MESALAYLKELFPKVDVRILKATILEHGTSQENLDEAVVYLMDEALSTASSDDEEEDEDVSTLVRRTSLPLQPEQEPPGSDEATVQASVESITSGTPDIPVPHTDVFYEAGQQLDSSDDVYPCAKSGFGESASLKQTELNLSDCRPSDDVSPTVPEALVNVLTLDAGKNSVVRACEVAEVTDNSTPDDPPSLEASPDMRPIEVQLGEVNEEDNEVPSGATIDGEALKGAQPDAVDDSSTIPARGDGLSVLDIGIQPANEQTMSDGESTVDASFGAVDGVDGALSVPESQAEAREAGALVAEEATPEAAPVATAEEATTEGSAAMEGVKDEGDGEETASDEQQGDEQQDDQAECSGSDSLVGSWSRSFMEVELGGLSDSITGTCASKDGVQAHLAQVRDLIRQVEAAEQQVEIAEESLAYAGQDDLSHAATILRHVAQAREALEGRAAQVCGNRALLGMEAEDLSARISALRGSFAEVEAHLAQVRAALEDRLRRANARLAEARGAREEKEAEGRKAREAAEAEMARVAGEVPQMEAQERACAELAEALVQRNREADELQGQLAVMREDLTALLERIRGMPAGDGGAGSASGMAFSFLSAEGGGEGQEGDAGGSVVETQKVEDAAAPVASSAGDANSGAASSYSSMGSSLVETPEATTVEASPLVGDGDSTAVTVEGAATGDSVSPDTPPVFDDEDQFERTMRQMSSQLREEMPVGGFVRSPMGHSWQQQQQQQQQQAGTSNGSHASAGSSSADDSHNVEEVEDEWNLLRPSTVLTAEELYASDLRSELYDASDLRSSGHSSFSAHAGSTPRAGVTDGWEGM
eukprot:TRINITY_DN139_c0_g1_i1.p1 TRINITY_DN139_c0_g1~~TRINITY_DN139_c0_g1_i1.p1  ORF type:complete len:822 (+),score=77.25 TRINITY_DN139_c0_g1_i1:286-2751(+)